MDYKTIGHNHANTVIDMIQAFFPNEKYKELSAGETSPRFLESRYENGLASARFFVNSCIEREAEYICDDGDIVYAIKRSIYKLWESEQGLPWGILTGIRPAKIASGLMEEGMNNAKIVLFMQERFMVSPERATLCAKVARAEQKLLEKGSDKGYSLYIGIPFCPSKCLYCSFTSYPIDKYSDAVESYIDAVKKAENDDCLILRMHECRGAKSKINIKSDYKIKSFAPCNLLEENIAPPVTGNCIETTINPFEIKTYKLWF